MDLAHAIHFMCGLGVGVLLAILLVPAAQVWERISVLVAMLGSLCKILILALAVHIIILIALLWNVGHVMVLVIRAVALVVGIVLLVVFTQP